MGASSPASVGAPHGRELSMVFRAKPEELAPMGRSCNSNSGRSWDRLV